MTLHVPGIGLALALRSAVQILSGCIAACAATLFWVQLTDGTEIARYLGIVIGIFIAAFGMGTTSLPLFFTLFGFYGYVDLGAIGELHPEERGRACGDAAAEDLDCAAQRDAGPLALQQEEQRERQSDAGNVERHRSDQRDHDRECVAQAAYEAAGEGHQLCLESSKDADVSGARDSHCGGLSSERP
jgi:hypothetical protein